MKIRVGFGFDVHQLVEGRELWLGGILLEHTKGLLGHSDADVSELVQSQYECFVKFVTGENKCRC